VSEQQNEWAEANERAQAIVARLIDDYPYLAERDREELIMVAQYTLRNQTEPASDIPAWVDQMIVYPPMEADELEDFDPVDDGDALLWTIQLFVCEPRNGTASEFYGVGSGEGETYADALKAAIEQAAQSVQG